MSRIFDEAGSMQRMGDDRHLFLEMVELLEKDAPPLLEHVVSTVQEGSLRQAERPAHTLKGLASNFGASRAVAAAADVERLAKHDSSDGMPAALKELEESFEELLAALAPRLKNTSAASGTRR